jgi:hypothetical protein
VNVILFCLFVCLFLVVSLVMCRSVMLFLFNFCFKGSFIWYWFCCSMHFIIFLSVFLSFLSMVYVLSVDHLINS